MGLRIKLEGADFSDSGLGNANGGFQLAGVEGISNGAIKTALSQLWYELRAVGLWPKITLLNLHVGTMRFNLKNPKDLDAAFRYAYTGAVSADYTANGFKYDGSTKHANTFWTPVDLWSFHFAVFNTTAENTSAERVLAGAILDTGNTFSISLTRNYPAGRTSFIAGTPTAQSAQAPSNYDATASKIGFLVGNRVSRTQNEVYDNGVLVGSSTSQAVAKPTIARTVYEGAFNGATVGFRSAATVSITSGGAALTASEVATYTQIINAFHTAIGRPVPV